MSNYLTLTKVLLKTSLSSIGEGKKKSQKWIYVVLVLCMLPSIGVYTMMFKELIAAMMPIEQVGYVYSVGLQSASLVIFIFSTFLIPSIYYFSKDTIHLLPLPLTSECIIASKLTVSIVYEYLFCLMILGPLFIAFALNGYSDPVFWIVNIFVFFTLPIYPLAVCSIFIVIIMRFVPFVRRKDIFNIVGSILLIVVVMAFSLYMSSIEEMDQNQMMNLLLVGKQSFVSVFNYLFPHISMISQALFLNKYLYILVYILIIVVVTAIFLLLAKLFYLKGALSIEETNSSRKKLSDEQLNKTLKQKNLIISYTIKELKLLLRTPAYVINCVLTEFIMPIMFIIGFISGGGSDITELLKQYLPYIDHILAYLLIIGLGLGFLASNCNMVAATSISREGAGYIFMKYIPVSLRTILNAKVLSGFIISQIMIIFVYIGLLWILPLSPIYTLLSFIAAQIGSIFGNYLGIIIDVKHPNLYWEEEATAVKRSISGIISMFLAFGIMAIVIVLCIITPDSLMNIMSMGIVGLCLVGCLFFYQRIDRVLKKSFDKL